LEREKLEPVYSGYCRGQYNVEIPCKKQKSQAEMLCISNISFTISYEIRAVVHTVKIQGHKSKISI